MCSLGKGKLQPIWIIVTEPYPAISHPSTSYSNASGHTVDTGTFPKSSQFGVPKKGTRMPEYIWIGFKPILKFATNRNVQYWGSHIAESIQWISLQGRYRAARAEVNLCNDRKVQYCISTMEQLLNIRSEEASCVVKKKNKWKKLFHFLSVFSLEVTFYWTQFGFVFSFYRVKYRASKKKLLCVENVGLQAPGQDLDPICCPLLVGLVHPNSSYWGVVLNCNGLTRKFW